MEEIDIFEGEEGFDIPFALIDAKMTAKEKLMIVYLLYCENLFNKHGDWFNLTDDDFVEKMGFGKNKVVLRKTRDSLIDRGCISFKRGVYGNKSSYKINRIEDEIKGL